MLTQKQTEIINSLNKEELINKIEFISTSYEGENKDEIIDALHKRLAIFEAPVVARQQFLESRSEIEEGVA